MTKMAAMPIYGKNPSKNLLLLNQLAHFHETWYVALGTPDLLYGKVKFCNLGFSVGKGKTVDISETIAAIGLKIGIY